MPQLRNLSRNVSRRLSSARRLLLVGFAVTALLSGCGDDAEPAATRTPLSVADADLVDKTGNAIVDITIKDNEFTPAYITITEGTKVVWTDIGDNIHNVIPIDDGAFAKASKLEKGSTHEVTFSKAGDYGYYCSFHGTKKNGQRGGIRVVAKK